MGTRIVRQPNGLFALFSEVVDNFTYFDMTEDEAKQICIDEGISEAAAKEKVRRGIEDRDPWKPEIAGSGLDRWNDALAIIKRVHGDAALEIMLAEMGLYRQI